MSGASEVPAIPDDVRKIVERFTCEYAPHLREIVQLDMALAIAADRLARPVDTGREKALEEAASYLERRADEMPNTLTAIGVAKILRGEAVSVRALANPENGRG